MNVCEISSPPEFEPFSLIRVGLQNQPSANETGKQMSGKYQNPTRPLSDKSAHGGIALAATAAVSALAFAAPTTAGAQSIQSFNEADYSQGQLPEGYSELTAKVQVLLDRADFSPGVIDGYQGGNTALAIRSLETANDLSVDGRMDEKVWGILTKDAGSAEPVFSTYEIRDSDTKGIKDELPEDYAKLAKMEWLGFTSVEEKIAEKFHMDVDFLRKINEGVAFNLGNTIIVASPGDNASGDVARVVIDKSREQIIALNGDGKTISTYPATIGSDQTPSPSGTHEVVGIAVDPTYSYKPDENFTQGDNNEQLTLPPGPNGPVGSVWIDLSKPTYGLHGNGDPASIGKTASHGCVRMTNWDAMELAELVDQGVPVEFRQ